MQADGTILEVMQRTAQPLASWDPILDAVGDATIVLLGESTHGTHEFYGLRRELTKRLIAERGFGAVALEADFSDMLRLNAYVRGASASTSPVLPTLFRRFPPWMWKNEETAEFVEWLRVFNQTRGVVVGLYGLDLHDAARGARSSEMRLDAEIESREERAFVELQWARIRARGGQYFRALDAGLRTSWNIRDRYMLETLEAIIDHRIAMTGPPARVVVWAHNSHVGDARATQMSGAGELSLGQLVRERHGSSARLVGLATHSGSVIAARSWGGPERRMRVAPALPESWEALLHQVGPGPFALDLSRLTERLGPARIERAIGAVYVDANERASHYFEAALARQFDMLVFFDETRAVDVLGAPMLRAGEQPAESP